MDNFFQFLFDMAKKKNVDANTHAIIINTIVPCTTYQAYQPKLRVWWQSY